VSGTQIMTRNEHILGGEPVFTGTRVPVRALFEYLAAGDPLDRFLAQFPNVTRGQAVAAIEESKTVLLKRV
jgi:uncharacterized protein (DUF433 family)